MAEVLKKSYMIKLKKGSKAKTLKNSNMDNQNT